MKAKVKRVMRKTRIKDEHGKLIPMNTRGFLKGFGKHNQGGK